MESNHWRKTRSQVGFSQLLLSLKIMDHVYVYENKIQTRANKTKNVQVKNFWLPNAVRCILGQPTTHILTISHAFSTRCIKLKSKIKVLVRNRIVDIHKRFDHTLEWCFIFLSMDRIEKFVVPSTIIYISKWTQHQYLIGCLSGFMHKYSQVRSHSKHSVNLSNITSFEQPKSLFRLPA